MRLQLVFWRIDDWSISFQESGTGEILRRAEISSCSKSIVCTKSESLGDDQTESASLGGQTDRQKGEQFKTSFTVQPDNMMGKYRDGEQNPLERAQGSEEEGKVVSKRECLAPKSPSSCEEMGGSGESRPVTPETAANGISHADQRGIFFFQAEVGMDLKTTQAAARHFVRLPMIVRQQRGATARSTDQGGKCLL